MDVWWGLLMADQRPQRALPSQAVELLGSSNPNPEADDRLMQFGRLVGSWALDVSFMDADGSEETTSAEWHWTWILDGRAIQDVLVLPARSQHSEGGHQFGTSLRLFDESAEIWKVVWVAPRSGTIYKLSGRFSEDDRVVLHGDAHDGEPTRWTFFDISESGFSWEGYVRDPPDTDWRLIQRMEARRTG